MKFVVLDDFPAWIVYIPALFVLCAFLVVLALLRRTYQAAEADSRAARRLVRWRPQLWIVTIAAAIGVWFMASSMFFRFHAIGFDPLHLELYYLWPQPSEVIDMSEVVDVKLSRGTRTCGHLEVATRHQLYVSVNFKKCDRAKELLEELPLERKLS
jgi:hypothetical protein